MYFCICIDSVRATQLYWIYHRGLQHWIIKRFNIRKITYPRVLEFATINVTFVDEGQTQVPFKNPAYHCNNMTTFPFTCRRWHSDSFQLPSSSYHPLSSTGSILPELQAAVSNFIWKVCSPSLDHPEGVYCKVSSPALPRAMHAAAGVGGTAWPRLPMQIVKEPLAWGTTILDDNSNDCIQSSQSTHDLINHTPGAQPSWESRHVSACRDELRPFIGGILLFLTLTNNTCRMATSWSGRVDEAFLVVSNLFRQM